ncbi:IS5 family transposase [Streptosporangium sp. 'caverna']|nr:IS5 family transposase [Streptosporangium sp. 'caverna']
MMMPEIRRLLAMITLRTASSALLGQPVVAGRVGRVMAGAAGDAPQVTPSANDADASSGQDHAATRRHRKARAKAAGLGRSRGGLSSKVHAAVDAAGLPLAFVLTPGQAADCPQFIPVLNKIRILPPIGRPRTRSAAVAADKAYSSKANRAYLRRRRISAVIPEKSDQRANRKKKGSAGGRPVVFDPERYRQRNIVERCLQKIKTWRGLGEVDSGRPADFSTSGFPRAASRTRRARLRVPGSPQVPL